jgi:hypothetical protein
MNEQAVSTSELLGVGLGVQAVILVSLLLVDHLAWVAGYLAVGYFLLDVGALFMHRKTELFTRGLARLLFYVLPFALLLAFALLVNCVRR